MKKLKVKKGISCMNCLACTLECARVYYKADDPSLAALKIVPLPKTDTDETKPVVCVQCGKCAEACPSDAITQNKNGVYMVNKKLCTGCGKCVEACPFHVMVKADNSPTASKCIACGLCAKACPMDILEIVES